MTTPNNSKEKTSPTREEHESLGKDIAFAITCCWLAYYPLFFAIAWVADLAGAEMNTLGWQIFFVVGFGVPFLVMLNTTAFFIITSRLRYVAITAVILIDVIIVIVLIDSIT